MIRYVFRDDEIVAFKAAKEADPQMIGEALTAIADDNDGHLRPHDVVEAARSEAHPLHRHFEWDDAVAAEAFRLEQARSIIRIVRVEHDESEDGSARAFLSVAERGGVSYRQFGEVQGSLNLQLAVLRQAERDLTAFERRYRGIEEICDLVRQARDRVKAQKERMESRTAA